MSIRREYANYGNIRHVNDGVVSGNHGGTQSRLVGRFVSVSLLYRVVDYLISQEKTNEIIFKKKKRRTHFFIHLKREQRRVFPPAKTLQSSI